MTGGTRGIGEAIARRLHRQGYAVTTCGSTEESVAACRQRNEKDSCPIAVEQLDVRDTDEMSRAFHRADEAAGGLKVLVCCTGRPVNGNAEELTLEEWDRGMDLNLRAHFSASKAAIPLLSRNGGGAIVLISSIWSQVTPSNRVAYTTAKTALTGLTRALAIDHADQDIRVNAVAPGYVETDLLQASLARISSDVERKMADLRERHPLKRLVSPEDVAASVAFLASEQARNITAQTLYVDGGITVKLEL